MTKSPDNKPQDKTQDETGLTTLWQEIANAPSAPEAAERANYYIQTGAVWLTFKKLVKEDPQLERYAANIAFNLSSGAGWDIKNGKVPYYYPEGEKSVHPFDFFVPVDHVIASLEKSDRFALGIERALNKGRNRSYYDEGITAEPKTALGKLFNKLVGKLLGVEPEAGSGSKKVVRHLSYEEKYLALGKMMVVALRDNKEHIRHKKDLDASNWKRYDPASGKPSPFYLSAEEHGASFDFTMRR